MKKYYNKLNEVPAIPPVCKIIILFVLSGMVCGYLTGHLLKTSLYSPLLTIYNDIICQMSDLDINHTDIFWLALKRNIKFYVLIYLFSVTNLWKYYCGAFSLYTGFSNGLLLSFNVILHGIPGIIRYVFYIFPQVLILAPLYMLLMYHCNTLNHSYSTFSTHSINDRTQKGKLLLQQFPFIMTTILLLILGCLTEAYVNLPLVLWYSTVS